MKRRRWARASERVRAGEQFSLSVNACLRKLSAGIRTLSGAWGKQMTLFEAVEGLDSLDDDSTIYAAEPWTGTSHAITLSEPNERVRAQQAAKLGLRYFLEVSIAREFLDGWATNFAQPPSPQEKCLRLIKYATNDA